MKMTQYEIKTQKEKQRLSIEELQIIRAGKGNPKDPDEIIIQPRQG